MAPHTLIDDSDEEFLYISIFIFCFLTYNIKLYYLIFVHHCIEQSSCYKQEIAWDTSLHLSKPQHPPKNTPTLVIPYRQREAFSPKEVARGSNFWFAAGIEYSGFSRCELWTRPEGIRSTATLRGFTCATGRKSGFQNGWVVNGGKTEGKHMENQWNF